MSETIQVKCDVCGAEKLHERRVGVRPVGMVAVTLAQPLEAEARRHPGRKYRRQRERYAELDICAACLDVPIALGPLLALRAEPDDDGDED